MVYRVVKPWGKGLGVTLVGVVLLSLMVGVLAVGAFDDDNGSVHESAIDFLDGEGILAGTDCGEGLICPGEPVQRWVLAVWLTRALDDGDPPGGWFLAFLGCGPRPVVGAACGTSRGSGSHSGMRHRPVLPRRAGYPSTVGVLPYPSVRPRTGRCIRRVRRHCRQCPRCRYRRFGRSRHHCWVFDRPGPVLSQRPGHPGQLATFLTRALGDC